MISRDVVISDLEKKYDNPLAELVQTACRFSSEVRLETVDRRINAKSIMGILAFTPAVGMAVKVVATGNDEMDAVEALTKYLTCKL